MFSKFFRPAAFKLKMAYQPFYFDLKIVVMKCQLSGLEGDVKRPGLSNGDLVYNPNPNISSRAFE